MVVAQRIAVDEMFTVEVHQDGAAVALRTVNGYYVGLDADGDGVVVETVDDSSLWVVGVSRGIFMFRNYAQVRGPFFFFFFFFPRRIVGVWLPPTLAHVL